MQLDQALQWAVTMSWEEFERLVTEAKRQYDRQAEIASDSPWHIALCEPQ